jgi:hypothetical protein
MKITLLNLRAIVSSITVDIGAYEKHTNSIVMCCYQLVVALLLEQMGNAMKQDKKSS